MTSNVYKVVENIFGRFGTISEMFSFYSNLLENTVLKLRKCNSGYPVSSILFTPKKYQFEILR